MMHTLIPDDLYRRLYKKHIFKQMKSGFGWFLLLPPIIVITAPLMYPEIDFDQIKASLFMGLAVVYGIIILLYGLIKILEKRSIYDKRPLEQYLSYQTMGMKVPLFQHVMKGKRRRRYLVINYSLLVLESEHVLFFSLGDKRENSWRLLKEVVQFECEPSDCRVHIIIESRKKTFQVLPEVYDRFVDYLKYEDIHFIEIGRNK